MSLPAGDLVHLRRGLRASAVLAVAAAGIGALLAGPTGALAGAAGAVLVAAFFSVSTLAVSWANTVSPSLVLPVGLTTYGIKIVLLGALLVALPQTPATRVLAITVLVCLVVWVTLQAVGVWRARTLYVDLPDPVAGQDQEAAKRPGP